MQQKFFVKPFAVAGDREPVPNDTQTTGDVSYEQGYGYDYQRDQASDPLAKPIERNRHNAILHDITEAVQQYQTCGTPEWITAKDNGGKPYRYARRARVRYRAKEADPWDVYESLVDNNTVAPSDTAKWAKVVSALASEQQAVAGTDNSTLMTPLRVAQATATKQTALGYTPVQQGTGIGQKSNAVKFGWSAQNRLKATIDNNDLGNVVFDSQLARYATTDWVGSTYASITYVDDRVNSRVPIRVANAGSGYVLNDSQNIITQNWNNRDRVNVYIDGSFQGAMAYTRDVETKANAGAQVQHNSGIVESSAWGAGSGAAIIDMGNPWVVQGIRTQAGPGWCWFRCVSLRNQ